MPSRKKSNVWLFFDTSVDKHFVVCRLCNKQMKYFTNTSNMRQHLIRKHRREYDEDINDGTSNVNMEENEITVIEKHSSSDFNEHITEEISFIVEEFDPPKTEFPCESFSASKRSRVWLFFEMCVGSNHVVCKLCNAQLKYFSSTTTLRHHLIRKHPREFSEHANGEISFDVEDSKITESYKDFSHQNMGPSKRSKVWLFFEKTADNRDVICRVCKKCLKYSSNTTNLKKHLTSKHREEYNSTINHIHSDVEEGETDLRILSQNIPQSKRSIMWLFFEKCMDNNYVVCRLCKHRLKYFTSTGNLIQHVTRKHPTKYNEYRNKGFDLKAAEIGRTDPEIGDDTYVIEICQDPLDITSEPCINDSVQIPALNDMLASSSSPPKYNSLLVMPTAKDASQIVQTSSTKHSFSSAVHPPKRARQLESNGVVKKLLDSKKKEIDSALLKMIVFDYQPLSIVESQGFLEFTKKLNPSYNVPSKHSLTNILLPITYKNEVAKVKYMFSKVEYVSLTINVRKTYGNKSYMSLSSHFIYNSKIHTRILGTRELRFQNQNEKSIAENLAIIINNWKLNDKIVTIVAENGDKIKNAVTNCLSKHHHICVVNTLNISIKEVLDSNDELKNLINKCKNIAEHFKGNVIETNKFTQSQKQMGLPLLKLKLVVDTRWNAVFLMLERLLEVKDPLSVVYTSLSSAPAFLDDIEWSIISDCVPILRPFKLMLAELSGEKYITLSSVIPLIRGLQFTLKCLQPTTETGLWLKNNLVEVISKRLGSLEMNKIAAMSTFLDPRFKQAAFDLDENAMNAHNWIVDELKLMILTNASLNDSTDDHVPEQSEQTLSLWSHFDDKVKNVKTNATPETTAALCVRQYLELPHCERSANPLDFWEKYKNMMPELYILHLKYLCIPATSVPSEKHFSNVNQLSNFRRNRLSPKYLNMILFLSSALNS